MTKGDYLERRLERSGNEALLNAQVAVNQVQSEAAKMGALGGGRVYVLYDEAVGKVLAEALQRLAVIAFRVSSGTSAATAQLLEKVGYKFVDDITDWLHKRYKSEIALGYTGPPVGALKATLNEMVRNAVDDFHHGMVGEECLKEDPVVSIVNNVTNSPSVVVQNAVGQNNAQSVQQQSLLGAIDRLVTSDEFNALGEQDRTAVQDVADVVRDEIKKPNADASKVARWGQRLIELAKQLGLDVAAAEIVKFIFG